jgi:hypothetical protein
MSKVLDITASEFPAGSSILAGLISELSSNGFSGLQSRIQQLAAMNDNPLAAAHPSDPSCVELLAHMASQINTAIEENSLSIFNDGMDCFTKVLNFICQGAPDLFLVQRAKASDIAPIRAMYLQVFFGIPVSLWPNYLYIFIRAYSSSLWVTWLREETAIHPERQQIHQIFKQYLSAGKVCNVLVHSDNDLLHERSKFLICVAQIYEFIKKLFNNALAPKASTGYVVYLEAKHQ